MHWLVSCKAGNELLSLLPISMMQVSPHAQGQKKGLKLSDTEVTGLQGELELVGKNGEMQLGTCSEAES